MSAISRPRIPALVRVPSLPAATRPVELPTFSSIDSGKPLRDEFGLAFSIYGSYPREQRRLVAKFLRKVGGSFDTRPPLGATIAEGVMFGLLLDNGYEWSNAPLLNEHQFRFQSYELGGRQPGGSVTDFYVIANAVRIAVRVQSAFHALISPFGTGGQVNAVDLRRRLELLASVFIDRVVDINEPPELVLEKSNSPERLRQELFRVLGYAA